MALQAQCARESEPELRGWLVSVAGIDAAFVGGLLDVFTDEEVVTVADLRRPASVRPPGSGGGGIDCSTCQVARAEGYLRWLEVDPPARRWAPDWGAAGSARQLRLFGSTPRVLRTRSAMSLDDATIKQAFDELDAVSRAKPSSPWSSVFFLPYL